MVVAEPSLILHPTLAIESMGNFHHHLMRNSHENQDPSTSVKKHPSAEIGGGVRFSHLTPHINISRPVKFNIPTSQLWQEVKNYRVEIEIGRRQTVIWMHFLVCPCPHWVEANFAREIKRDRGRSASKTIKPECHGRFVKSASWHHLEWRILDRCRTNLDKQCLRDRFSLLPRLARRRKVSRMARFLWSLLLRHNHRWQSQTLDS